MKDSGHHKETLEKERDVLEKELQGLGVHNQNIEADWIPTPASAPTSTADPNVVADRAEDWEERRAIVEDLEIRWNNVRRALTKIEDGSYGTCELCNAPIEADRLNANPAARTCKTHIEDEAQLLK